MSELGEKLAKLSKSQKKKKSAQKKKLAKKNARAEEEHAAVETQGRKRNEADARIVEQHHDRAMYARDFQMLNIRGKLLVHPSKSFLDALTTLRQAMCRDTYPNRINHARRLLLFGVNTIPWSSWSVTMGTTSYLPYDKFPRVFQWSSEGYTEVNSHEDDHDEGHANKEVKTPVMQGQKWISLGALGLMTWYPIFATCMAVGDKLACIALRDTCKLLRACYGIFRNDITKLEQFVFDARNPTCIKQLDWVARRVEVPPSPPETPPNELELEPTTFDSDNFLTRDPFRSPIVVTKRWADYDDDDESLGSPMSLPITPESLGSDIPTLNLDESGGNTTQGKGSPRRTPSVVIAIPILTDSAYWFGISKTVLPVSRFSLFTFEDFPRPHRTSSPRPMKLQSSTVKYVPGPCGKIRVRARLEHWVREDIEKNLKTKLSLGLSGAAKKMVDTQTESVVFNRVTALASANNGDLGYIGEPDILGAGLGLSVEDVRDIVIGRYRPEKGNDDHDDHDRRMWSEYWSEDAKAVKIMLVPSAEGWICRHLGDLQP